MSGFWTCYYVSIDDSIRGSHVPVRFALQCERVHYHYVFTARP